jgi:YbbR domain-containing protein
VDLSDNQPGDRVVNLTRERVSMGLPEGVHIDDIEPNTVPLRLEPRVERLVKVEARLEGTLPEGYEVLGFKVTPAEVRVRGPESHVDALQKAPTETILIGGRRETFLANQVAVDVPDQKLNVLDPVVNVAVEIGEKRVEKSFANVTIVTDSGGKARPSRADIILSGPRSVLDNLHSSDIQLTLVSEDNGQVTTRLVLSQGSNGAVELRSTKPAVFSIIR